MRKQPEFTEDSINFMERMLNQSGVGPATAWPPGIINVKNGMKYDSSIEASRNEAEVCDFRF